MLNKWMLLMALALTLAQAHAAQNGVTVVQADGEEVLGILTEMSPEGVTVDARKISAKDVSQIKFSVNANATIPTSATAAPTTPNVILRNQDVIAQAVILSGGDTNLKLRSTWLTAIELEYKAIDAIVFYAASKKMPDSLSAILKAAPLKEDALLLLKGETITGFYEKLSDKEISFNAGGQSKKYPLEQIAAVRLAATEKFEVSKAYNAVLNFVDGSRLTVKPIDANGDMLNFEALDGKTLRISGAGISSLEFSGGRMVYLSALTPKTVEQKPYVGGAPVVFSWRKDRSSANGPLKIGETVYEKGIGVHSYCKLGYELNGAYAKFICDVGMDASAPTKSECAWKILVDGKESAGGSARAGGEKRTVRIEVTGAKVLELVCDFGSDDDDAGDRLDFAKARLIKP